MQHTVQTYNYALVPAGDPLFDGEQAASISGTACLECGEKSLGLVDLGKLPSDYILHHKRLETIDNTGVRKVALLCFNGSNKIKFDSETLTLERL